VGQITTDRIKRGFGGSGGGSSGESGAAVRQLGRESGAGGIGGGFGVVGGGQDGGAGMGGAAPREEDSQQFFERPKCGSSSLPADFGHSQSSRGRRGGANGDIVGPRHHQNYRCEPRKIPDDLRPIAKDSFHFQYYLKTDVVIPTGAD